MWQAEIALCRLYGGGVAQLDLNEIGFRAGIRITLEFILRRFKTSVRFPAFGVTTEAIRFGVSVITLIGTVATWGHWALVPLLIAVILYDVRFMRLPNLLALLFAMVFAVTIAWTLPLGELVWRVGVALIVLSIGIAANTAKLLGGGDVKILSALVLFVPRSHLLASAFILCICMIVGIFVLLSLRRLLRGVYPTWSGLQEGARYPMGISIGMAGLIVLFFQQYGQSIR